ncbi:type IV pilus assembly protein PilC [Peribacillus deserti]|uniref:Type IV pilus assembly protein PilC n=1 Tax=Peribacillus deserti TaxID=673318 RepID=A0ABS2QI12_9BACI|nr:type II secretion system F family protein [Peribacillus deserti]MBM7691931.1 type IV pilus assembly protein PilC [Peribacillus deserti]
MPVFRYQGRDRTGKQRAGRVTALNKKEAVGKVRESGIAVISIEELKGILYKEIQIGIAKKIKYQDLVIYIRQFSTLLKAGISIVEANSILAHQTSSKLLKKVLGDIGESLREGKPYTEAAEEHRRIFPPLYINMMRAGEAGGNLDEILERMADYYEKQNATRQKIKSALMYPAFVGVISIAIVIFLLSTVVPAFADMFSSFGGKLPLVTRIVIHLADFFKQFWWVFLLLALVLYIGVYFIRKNRDSKYYLDFVLLRIPLFGKLLQKAAIARMARTLASLFSSSVPILQSLTIVERIIGNEVHARVLNEAKFSIEKGQSISRPMESHWAFPPMVTSMISIGEKSGTIDVMLEKIASFYEAEVENATEQIKSLIEPIMIVLLAFMVGGIVAAIAVPMFSIFQQIQ